MLLRSLRFPPVNFTDQQIGMEDYTVGSQGWRIDTVPAFCINLERRPDRWREIVSQPGVAALPRLKRFTGVDGKLLDIRGDARIPLMTKRNILANMRRTHEELDTAGGVGCALSHIAVWEWIVQNRSPVTLILEDDANMPVDFVSRANRLLEKSPMLRDSRKWDVVLFTPDTAGCEATADPSVMSCGAFLGLQAYLITLECAERFLEEAYTIHMHIDLWMGVYKSVYGLRILSVPGLSVGQRSSKTDIQNKHGCAICDVKTSFEDTHSLVRNEEVGLMRVIEVAAVAGLA